MPTTTATSSSACWTAWALPGPVILEAQHFRPPLITGDLKTTLRRPTHIAHWGNVLTHIASGPQLETESNRQHLHSPIPAIQQIRWGSQMITALSFTSSAVMAFSTTT